MSNRLEEVLKQIKRDRGITVPKLAEMSGVPASTIYGAKSKETLEKFSIDAFIKIAHALGMTADELYTGIRDLEPKVFYSDPRQQDINDIYESVDEDQKRYLWETAKMVALAYPSTDGSDHADDME